jgi:hypothetical protein
VTDKYPDITVKKLVSPTQDRTAYAKQLLTSGQFPDALIAVSPAGFAESGNLYAWQQSELKDFTYPGNGAVGGKVYQLPANTASPPGGCGSTAGRPHRLVLLVPLLRRRHRDLDAWGLETTRRLLASPPSPTPFPGIT